MSETKTLTKVNTSSYSFNFQFKNKIFWSNVYFWAVVHILAVYALFHLPQAKWLTLVTAAMFSIMGNLGITAGSHRLWAHRSYKAKLPLRMFLVFCNSVAFEHDVIKWARDHRVHHKFTETEADPYNSRRGFFFSHIGWILTKKNEEVKTKGKTVDISDMEAEKLLMFQRKHFYEFVLLFSIILPTLIPVYFSGEKPLTAFLIAFVLRYVYLSHCVFLTNSAAHMFGYKPYDKNIKARENHTVSWFTLGEGFHNYHHVFPWDYAASEWGFKLNLTTMFIDSMAAIGQAYDLKKVEKSMVGARSNRTGDGVKLD